MHAHALNPDGVQVYLVGGRHLNDTVVDNVHVYDLTTEVNRPSGRAFLPVLNSGAHPCRQSWSTLPNAAVSVSDLTAFLLDGVAYVVGGYNQGLSGKHCGMAVLEAEQPLPCSGNGCVLRGRRLRLVGV